THHVMHTMGSRVFGFTQELFNDPPNADPQTQATMVSEMAATYPHIAELLMAISHDRGSIVGPGCDDQFEFEFALDLLLDGIERLARRTPPARGRAPDPRSSPTRPR